MERTSFAPEQEKPKDTNPDTVEQFNELDWGV